MRKTWVKPSVNKWEKFSNTLENMSRKINEIINLLLHASNREPPEKENNI